MIFFTQWSDAVIVPALKRGDQDDRNNYRDISLMSCFVNFLPQYYTFLIEREVLISA